jgi:hypothetical protein
MISKFLGRSGHHKQVARLRKSLRDSGQINFFKVAEEISGAVKYGSGIETSVLSYDGTNIPTGARLNAA